MFKEALTKVTKFSKEQTQAVINSILAKDAVQNYHMVQVQFAPGFVQGALLSKKAEAVEMPTYGGLHDETETFYAVQINDPSSNSGWTEITVSKDMLILPEGVTL